MVDQLPTSTGEFAGFLNHQPYDAHGHVNFCTVKQLAFFSGLPKHGVYTFKGWKMKAHHKKKMLLNTYSIWLVVSTQLKICSTNWIMKPQKGGENKKTNDLNPPPS